MPLKLDQVDHLLKVLSVELTEGQTLETIANAYHSLLPTADLFQVCMALSFMLKNLEDFNRTGTKRLVACFLIYECYKNQPIVSNPFVSILMELYAQHIEESIQQKDVAEREKQFLQLLLLDESPKKDLVKLTPKQILYSNVIRTSILEPLRNRLGQEAIEIQAQQFEQNLSERCKDLAISTVLAYPEQKSWTVGDSTQSVQRMLKELFCNPDSVIEQHFIPEMISLNPPTHYCENEFYFSFPSELQKLEFLWDATTTADKEPENTSSSLDNDSSMEIRQLLAKAFRMTLNLHQQHSFISQLSENPSLVMDSGLTSQNFPDLVEHNPLAAIEVLRALMRTDQFTEYLTVLVNMEMSVHSMEVVKLLTAEVELPSDIIVSYLCNCMSTCEQIKDHYTQNRLVRLFCVFLQSLIKNKTINVKDIAIEVQCFCIQFSGFKEASALYRMLKSSDQAEESNLSVDCNAKESTSSNSNLSSPSG